MYNRDGTLQDRREMLRVKAKSLAEEARIIRREEGKTSGSLQQELRWHRTSDVRYEARATYLAYGIIRGREVGRIERPRSERPESFWKKVRSMVEKYGPTDREQKDLVLAKCKE